ncbi:MAG: helix-hairpin-helix domain-containing protein [Bacilli bacterium]|nr:helix-hairpin-helix domain-containing protein [Bacilli bacterium]
MIKIIILVILATVVGLAVFNAVDNATGGGGSDPTEPIGNTITVSITGEVNKVGTYYIDTGSSLADLIAAAGDVTSNADPKAYNSTFVLANKQSFYIAPIYRSSETCSSEPIEKVNINTASAEEIDAVKGFVLNQGVADNIVEYRKSKGAFARIEELKDVSYIGAATFEKMKDYVTLK